MALTAADEAPDPCPAAMVSTVNPNHTHTCAGRQCHVYGHARGGAVAHWCPTCKRWWGNG